MLITQTRRPYFLLLLLGIFVVSFVVSIALNILWHDLQFVNEPLHSTLEAFGGLAAISMALLLLQLDRNNLKEKRDYFLLSMGFFMMGITDTCHAVSTFGNGFILLHSLASFFGSFWFAAVWFPGINWNRLNAKTTRWLTIFFCVLLGIFILRYRHFFPLMIVDGKFTPFATITNLLSGILTIAGAFYFFLQFLRSSKTESYLFTCMLFLLGLSALEFPISVAWNEDWWFWHIQRCLAYTVVFYYMLMTFLRVSEELKQSNELLENRIAKRTEELSKEIAERKLYGSQRDKVIAELQEALLQIKTLTGLLPTCASCKKIKDIEGNWVQMESYIQKHSNARFSHGICPTCAKNLYPEVFTEFLKIRLAKVISTLEILFLLFRKEFREGTYPAVLLGGVSARISHQPLSPG